MRCARAVVALAMLSVMAVAGAAQSRTPARAERSNSAVELTKAEDAIARNDFASAEPLLNKIVQAEPRNAVAWFDLGYVFNATDRRDQAIAAYQHAVDVNPDFFEANLHLGLALAAKSDPQAVQYLRAATRLKPAAHAEQGWLRAWMALGQVLENS